MCRLPRCALAFVSAFAIALNAAEPPTPPAAGGSEPPPATPGPPAHPILNIAPRARPSPLVAPASRPRLISPETAARLAAAAPKFDAQAAQRRPVTALPLDEGVLSLERFIVEGERPPNLKDRELLTPETKIRLGYQRNPGLKIGSLPFLNNDAWAREMVEEELELERRREMSDLRGLLPKQTKVPGGKAAKSWAETGGSWAERKR